MFKSHKATPKIEMFEDMKVLLLPIAYQKMGYYVDLCDKEIGWLGLVEKIGNYLVVKDAYLFKQEVASTTCEITPEGLCDFATEILQQPNGTEIYNNVRLWGHSHVRMGVSPSGQDDSQMKVFKDSGHPFFLRVIANKNGAMEFTYYDYANNLVIKDMPWDVYYPVEAGLKESIEAEMKAKVTEIKYETTGYAGYGQTSIYSTPSKAEMERDAKEGSTRYKEGYVYNKDKGKWYPRETKESKEEEKETTVKYETDIDEEFIYNNFNLNDLFDIGCCGTLKQAMIIIDECSVLDYSIDDCMKIWEVSKELYEDTYGYADYEDITTGYQGGIR